MKRSFHTSAAGTVLSVARLLAAVGLVGLAWSCGRTIEEEEPRALVEHRIEPCEQWCTPMMSPECGGNPEDFVFPTVDECVEDCAAVEPVYAWPWGRQADGTDACAEEWFAAADCIDALTCEEQRTFFRWNDPNPNPAYPCKEELDARRRCYYDAIEQGGHET
jgi:hypothetical protein